MKIGFVRSLLMVGVVFLAAVPAFSQTTFTLNSDANTVDDVYITPSDGGSEPTDAGNYNATLANGVVSLPELVYCVDPYNTIDFSQSYTLETAPPAVSVNGPSGLEALSYSGTGGPYTISSTVADQVDYLAYNYLDVTTFSANNDGTDDNQAAVQLAIWSLIDPGPNSDYNIGNSTVDSLETYYQGLATGNGVNWVANNSSDASNVYVISQAGVNPQTIQDFVYVLGGGPTANFGPVTPEPNFTAFLCSLLAAVGILFLMKRRSSMSA